MDTTDIRYTRKTKLKYINTSNILQQQDKSNKEQDKSNKERW